MVKNTRFSMRGELEDIWNAAIDSQRFDPDIGVSESAFRMIMKSYSSGKRKYHDLRHLYETINTLVTVYSLDRVDFSRVVLALMFHDVVYDTSGTMDNESASANAASKYLGAIGFPSSEVAVVSRLILSTSHSGEPGSRLEAIVRDCDLSALGHDGSFIDIERLIREEYKDVPYGVYASERKKILRKIYNGEHIFYTQEMSNLDGVARMNILENIAILGAKVVVGGTFDLLHDGHKKLLNAASWLARDGMLYIGITSDDMASKKSHPVQPFSTRFEQVVNYVNDITDSSVVLQVIPLDDPFGDTITSEYDILVASEETRGGAYVVNEERIAHNKVPLALAIIEPVKDSSGERISSTKLRKSM